MLSSNDKQKTILLRAAALSINIDSCFALALSANKSLEARGEDGIV